VTKQKEKQAAQDAKQVVQDAKQAAQDAKKAELDSRLLALERFGINEGALISSIHFLFLA
jgi:hypothetical protein